VLFLEQFFWDLDIFWASGTLMDLGLFWNVAGIYGRFFGVKVLG
jgi:hypothetical protein